MTIRPAKREDRKSLSKICFNTRAGVLREIEDRDSFTYRWAGNYLENYTEFCFVAEENSNIIGYIVATPDTIEQENRYIESSKAKIERSAEFLETILDDYPAHLHINLTKDARGKGVGSELIKALEKKLLDFSIYGIHLGVMEENRAAVGFYKKNGFKLLKKKNLGDEAGTVLFMGKNLA